MVRTAFSSISCCKASMVGSAATTRLARSESRWVSAWMASAISRSASPPNSATKQERTRKTKTNTLAVCSFIIANSPPSAEAAGDVILGAPVVRCGEHLAGGAELDQLAEIHEGGEVGHACRLLHVVGHNDDGVFGLQFVDQLLY